MSEKSPGGWGWPLNSRKAHYFVENVSLCGKWAFFGDNLERDKHGSPDNCKACRRKRTQRVKK